MMYAWISVRFSAIFAKTNDFCQQQPSLSLISLFVPLLVSPTVLKTSTDYLFLLVSAAIYCNSLFSRDYLDKREELRQAREERFVYHASILPSGYLHFLYSLLWSCRVFTFLTLLAQNTFIPKDFCKKEVVKLESRMKSSCKHSNK